MCLHACVYMCVYLNVQPLIDCDVKISINHPSIYLSFRTFLDRALTAFHALDSGCA